MRFMRLQNLRNRIKQHLSPQPSQTPEQTRHAAAEAGGERAGAIVELQQEVQRLQQAISELSRTDDSRPDPTTDARLATFQGELERTQQDLARFRGRI